MKIETVTLHSVSPRTSGGIPDATILAGLARWSFYEDGLRDLLAALQLWTRPDVDRLARRVLTLLADWRDSTRDTAELLRALRWVA